WSCTNEYSRTGRLLESADGLPTTASHRVDHGCGTCSHVIAGKRYQGNTPEQQPDRASGSGVLPDLARGNVRQTARQTHCYASPDCYVPATPGDRSFSPG